MTLLFLKICKREKREKKGKRKTERESVCVYRIIVGWHSVTRTDGGTIMSGITTSTTELVRNISHNISQAALDLEARWTYSALRRVSPDIALRLHDQRNLFAEACVNGTRREIVKQGEALCRGYAAAVRALEQSGETDDGYMLGTDLVTGTKIAIGFQRAALPRIREIHGEAVIWVTPDECARMLAGLESFKSIGAVKRLFPGAEILDRYPDETNETNDEMIYDGDQRGQDEAGTR
jgi:hypothetical protein